MVSLIMVMNTEKRTTTTWVMIKRRGSRMTMSMTTNTMSTCNRRIEEIFEYKMH